VVDVVPAALRAAVARQPHQRRRRRRRRAHRHRPSQGLRPLPVLRSVPPHVHLQDGREGNFSAWICALNDVRRQRSSRVGVSKPACC
jgi:hypothetical protein